MILSSLPGTKNAIVHNTRCLPPGSWERADCWAQGTGQCCCQLLTHKNLLLGSVLNTRSMTMQNEVHFPGGNWSPGSVLITRNVAVPKPRSLLSRWVPGSMWTNERNDAQCNVPTLKELPGLVIASAYTHTHTHLYPDKHYHFWVKYF